jgi:hypothetical protein
MARPESRQLTNVSSHREVVSYAPTLARPERRSRRAENARAMHLAVPKNARLKSRQANQARLWLEPAATRSADRSGASTSASYALIFRTASLLDYYDSVARVSSPPNSRSST